MTLYQRKSFQVPSTTPTKTPCGIHHFVKGKCLRCDQRIGKVGIATTKAGEGAYKSVPTDSEGAE